MGLSETPGKMYALAGTLSVLAGVAVILRFYSRQLLKTTRVGIDDYMILPALLFTLGMGLCMVIAAALGDLGRHTKIDINGMPEFTHRTQIFQQIVFASALMQTLTFGFTKLAVLLFYKRIFTNGQVIYTILAMIVIVIIWTTAFLLATLLQCFPISVNWTGWGGTVDACINTNAMFMAQAWSDVAIDVVILSLPLPCIWQLRMPTSQRLGVCGTFLLGTLVIAAGVAKLVAFNDVVASIVHSSDVTYILTPTLYWPMVEASLGIVGACLPSMRPICRKVSLENILHSIRSLPTISSTRWRKSFSIGGQMHDAGPKPEVMNVSQGSFTKVGANHDIVASKTNTSEFSSSHDPNRFDDLPDFPSLVDSKYKGRRHILADNIV